MESFRDVTTKMRQIDIFEKNYTKFLLYFPNRIHACTHTHTHTHTHTCAVTLQIATEQIVDMFMHMGLMTNANKTKAMIGIPGQLTTRLSSPAYWRMMGNLSEATFSARKRRCVICDICEMAIQTRSLAHHHQHDQHGIAIPIIAENRTPPHHSHLSGKGPS
jgi:hypothetical protein